MTVIVTRAGKGSALTYTEMDANFTNLNLDKLEAGHPASQVANTPAGGIIATDVQTAINELDTEKAPKANPTFTGNGSIAGTLAMGSAFESRNKLINGNFSINQRNYVSGASVGAGLYGHDRWKMAASADAYTFSTVANVTTVTIPAGKVLRQVIEGVNLQPGTHVLSWAGTAQGKIGAGSYGASGITGSAVGGSDLTIEFGPGTVSKAQFEEGSIATPFANHPYGLELALCQRYFWRGAGAKVFGTTSAIYSSITRFPVTMRVAPTVTLGAGSLDSATEDGFTSYLLCTAGFWYDPMICSASTEL